MLKYYVYIWLKFREIYYMYEYILMLNIGVCIIFYKKKNICIKNNIFCVLNKYMYVD